MESLIIPSLVQRIRSFLVEMCGMKVKPWATTEETLAALHTTLVARHQCQIFWTSLGGLLETLARDLKARQEASPGTLVDNELLDSERYASLLDEIRAVLGSQAAEPATFRRLASALSAPALGLLLLLGGAATVGCDPGSSTCEPAPPTVEPVQPEDAGSPDATDATITQPVSNPDALVVVEIDAGDDRATVACGARDASGPIVLDGGTVTIQDIMQSCNLSDQQQAGVLSCLAKLRASWTLGVAEALAVEDCNCVPGMLACFLQRNCSGIPSSQDFEATAFICPPVIVYAGVRFV
jgi:hypothetical protein